MTTPVESHATREGSYVVTFTMPKDYSLDDLPSPNDARVKVRALPAATMATLNFSGTARNQDLDALSKALFERAAKHGYKPISTVTIAQYDPPWIPGPLRRNELMVEVTKLK